VRGEIHAPIAQLDRASVYGTEGFWFESRWVYTSGPSNLAGCFLSGIALAVNAVSLVNKVNLVQKATAFLQAA
jgi:hypothetical protein